MSDLRSAIENTAPTRKRWPWVAAAVAIVVIIGVVFAVVRGGDSANGAGDSAGDQPVRGGTLQFASIEGQLNIDPQAANNYPDSIIADNITDKLTWQDPNTGAISPWLAESFSYNDTLTEFTFHLRKDVTFSDGSPLNADVVKANFDQYAKGDKALGIPPRGASVLPNYVGTDVVDGYTVVVKFAKPTASFLQGSSFTGGGQFGILALSTLEKTLQERSDPKNVIGTGPFVYESVEPQVRTVLVKRKGYNWSPPALHHQGEAYLDKIVFNAIPEASVRTGSLSSGTIDATLDVGTTDEAPLKAQGFTIISRAVSGTAIKWDLNTSLFPTDDINVRKAIQLGWSREAIQKTVLTGSYSVATSVLAPSVPGYVDYSGSVLKYDPDQAKKLLDDDGWVPGSDGIRVKDGKRLTVKLLGINNLVVNKPAYESIQQDLKKIGIDLQLTVVPVVDWNGLKAGTKGRTDWNINAANSSRDDPVVINNAYNPLLSNGSFLNPGTPEYDQAVQVLSGIETTLDKDKRAQAVKDAQDLVLDKLALVNPVYNPTQVIAHAKYVHGIIFDAQSRNIFVDTWKSNGK